TAPPEAKPGDAGEPGLVDQALDRLKEKAGEAASQAVEAGKEKLRQGAQDLKERAADELRRQLGTEQPAGGKKPGE
ncbi:MAG: hypothetical protein HYU66_11295, partial [Armatimonadetes bacterium]|nr:hypothetical protein [Armatimonadota bacterium]